MSYVRTVVRASTVVMALVAFGCAPPDMTADECRDPEDSCRLVIFPGDECPRSTELVGYVPEGSPYGRPSVCCESPPDGCTLP